MLIEKPNALATRLLHRYVRFLLWRTYHSVRVDGFQGFEAYLKSADASPLIFYGNHRGWWDGFFVFMLGQRYGVDMRVMMEEQNLRRYAFFRYTGAFGVDLQDKASRTQSLLHAVRFLRSDNGKKALLIYPHGRLVSSLEKNWPPFEPGIEALLRLSAKAKAVPVIHEIVPGKYRKPEVFIEIGKPVSALEKPSLSELEAAHLKTREAMIAKALGEPSPEAFYLRGSADSRG